MRHEDFRSLKLLLLSAVCTYDARGRVWLIRVISCSDTRMNIPHKFEAMLTFPLCFQFIVPKVTKGLMTSRA